MSCLCGRPAGPVARRGEHLADEEPVRREARHHDVVDLAGRVAPCRGPRSRPRPAPRRSAPRDTPVRPVSGACATATTARLPGNGRPVIVVADPAGTYALQGIPSNTDRRPGSRSGSAAVDGQLDAAAGDRDDRRLLLRPVEEHRLAVLEAERPEREVPPAGPGGVGRDHAVGPGPDVEQLGRQARRQLGGVDHDVRSARRWRSWVRLLRSRRSAGQQVVDLGRRRHGRAAHQPRGDDSPRGVAPLERGRRVEAAQQAGRERSGQRVPGAEPADDVDRDAGNRSPAVAGDRRDPVRPMLDGDQAGAEVQRTRAGRGAPRRTRRRSRSGRRRDRRRVRRDAVPRRDRPTASAASRGRGSSRRPADPSGTRRASRGPAARWPEPAPRPAGPPTR